MPLDDCSEPQRKKEITSTPTYQATGVVFILEYLKHTSEFMEKWWDCFLGKVTSTPGLIQTKD